MSPKWTFRAKHNLSLIDVLTIWSAKWTAERNLEGRGLVYLKDHLKDIDCGSGFTSMGYGLVVSFYSVTHIPPGLSS
jgi:hypothetical protein